MLQAALKLFYHPGIEALARKSGGETDPPVKIRSDASYKLAREGSLWLLPARFAESEVVLDGVVEGFAQLRNGGTLESDDVPSVDHFSMEKLGLVVVLNASHVPFVFHHGVTPASVRNRRIERRAPLSVSFWGWGRWKTARTPPKAIRTRDPSPAEISAP